MIDILFQTTLITTAIIGFLVLGGWLTDQWFTLGNRIIDFVENRKRSDKK